MSLLPLFTWIENSKLGDTIRSSVWMFPVIEIFHLLGLAVIGGAVLLVDMRLLGLGLRNQPVAKIARNAEPWLIGSLLVMVASGLLLFISEAIKCYYHAAFWFKMSCLFLAILFTFTVQRRLVLSDEVPDAVNRGRIAALVSLALWSGVGIGGRWIGFS